LDKDKFSQGLQSAINGVEDKTLNKIQGGVLPISLL
jgi:hypothetical protein